MTQTSDAQLGNDFIEFLHKIQEALHDKNHDLLEDLSKSNVPLFEEECAVVMFGAKLVINNDVERAKYMDVLKEQIAVCEALLQ